MKKKCNYCRRKYSHRHSDYCSSKCFWNSVKKSNETHNFNKPPAGKVWDIFTDAIKIN